MTSNDADTGAGASHDRTLPGVWTRPYGDQPGFAEDHLHLDIGYVTTIPRDAPGS